MIYYTKFIIQFIKLKIKTMLNLFNNNYSLFDHNILSYGLLLGSVSILGYSIYYFTGYLSNTYVHKSVNSLPNADTFTQRLVENLENQPITSLDTVVPKLDKIVEASLNKVDASVQTISNNLVTNIQNLPIVTDNFAQTSDKHLANKIQEILYGMCSEGEDLSNIDPVTFANEIRYNPQYSGWFNSIQDWANNIKTSSGKSFNSSELDFLKKVKDELNSVANSPIIETNNPVTDILQLSHVPIQNLSESLNTHDMMIRKLLDNDLIYTYAGIINETHLRTTLDLYNITLTDYNFNETLRLLMSLAVS